MQYANDLSTTDEYGHQPGQVTAPPVGQSPVSPPETAEPSAGSESLAAGEPQPPELACSEPEDPRVWVDMKCDVSWPSNWYRPAVLIHYPPRRGRWFWERWPGLGARCPVGSIAVVPRPLTREEVDEMVDWYAAQYGALLCLADRSYLHLQIGTVRGDGQLNVRCVQMVPAWKGQWENQIGASHMRQLDQAVDMIVARPTWQTRARRAKWDEPIEDEPIIDPWDWVIHPNSRLRGDADTLPSQSATQTAPVGE